MKLFLKLLILAVAVTVLSAWTFRLEMDSIYRGADASNMIEEFQAYGLNQTTMIVVGIFKVMCALFLLLGLKYEKFITPAAFVMGTFMLAAIYFHLSISDPIIPTVPSTMMFLSCIAIIYLDKKVSKSL
tara:strand:- start:1801 stop:2187 length:387 start_codon:yes stop_codon:yes gene_type:complete